MDAAYRANPSQNVLGIQFTGNSVYEYALRFNYLTVPGTSTEDRDLSKH